MAGITLKINAKEYQAKLKQLKLKHNLLAKRTKDSKEPLDKARFLIYGDVINHFRKEESPRGKWKSLKPATLKRRRLGSRKILQDTGRLRMSISHNRVGQTIKVGTNLIYARPHNEGFAKRNIPQREFMWVSDKIKKRTFDNFRLYISKG